MKIMRLILLCSIVFNLLAVPAVAAGNEALRGGVVVVVPSDVFNTVFLFNLPLQVVAGLITENFPIDQATSPEKKSPVQEKKNTSAECGIVPGSFSVTTLKQAGDIFAPRAGDAKSGFLRSVGIRAQTIFSFPPVGGFIDALRRYLVIISAAGLPSAMSIVVRMPYVLCPANSAGFFYVRGTHV